MKKHESSSQLKARSKVQLFGKYTVLIGSMLLVQLVLTSTRSLLAPPTGRESVMANLLTLAIELFLMVLEGIFAVGKANQYLCAVNGSPVVFNDVFYGFKNQPAAAVLIRLFQAAFTFVCILPCCLCIAMYRLNPSAGTMLAVSITACFGAAALCVLTLLYSQSIYLLLDFPDRKAIACLKGSRILMKGQLGRLFYLEVSFLPMYLLGILSLGIGFLFIQPYVQCTRANFYMDLMQQQ